MEKKIIFGTLAGLIAGMIVGMGIFMGVFGGMMEEWLREFGSCLKPMNPIWWVVGGVFQALLYAILLHRFGVITFQGGAIAGAWISLLICLWFGLAMASTYTAYPWSWLPYDVIGNTVSGAAAGGAIGWIYSRMK